MGIMGNNFAQTTPLKLALENFPPFQNRCRKKPANVMVLSRSHYDEIECIFGNIASLQSLYKEVKMSQLVRRQVKPLISSDQV